MSTFSSYFEQGLIRLDELASLNLKHISDHYPLVPLVSRNWKTSEKRLLILVESVDRTDLRDKKLLSTAAGKRGGFENPMTHLLPELLDRAQLMTSRFIDAPEDHSSHTEFALSVANFNAAPSYTLEGSARKAINLEFAHRALEIIRKLKPTHVLVSGDSATRNILERLNHPEAANSQIKRGWVLKCEYQGVKFKLTPTLDLESVYNPKSGEANALDDDDNDQADKYAVADLLYFVARNLSNLLAGKHLYSLRHITPKPVYVDTVKKFERMMEDLDREEVKRIALDSENAGLESYTNRIYMLQFAYEEDWGYVLPIQHPKSPFSKAEQAYILSRLRKFFGRRNRLKTFVYLNGMYDMRILRAQLNINVIKHHTIEVTGAESLLDENIGLFGKTKWRVDTESLRTSYQNLRNLFCLYENDLYYRMPFSKEERGTCGAVDPHDQNLLNYASLDAQAVIGILRMQIRRAKATYVKPFGKDDYESYYPWFIRHLKNQMAHTVEGISMMEQAGSPIDMEYLQLLGSKVSPLKKSIHELEMQLRASLALKEAERRLSVVHGRSQGGLFGSGSSATFFSFSKKAHLETLFFDVLGLEPVLYTKTGERSIDKNFVKQYQDDVYEVNLFGQLVKTKKLLSTYVKGWYEKVLSSVDSARLSTLNPSFGFFTIVTGRLNSFDPSLQQIPSRGPTAKYIKRMFRAPKGELGIKYDYSAQEVRQWSVLSKDRGVAASFETGLKLRQQWIVAPTEELKKRLKKEGDVHIANCYRFFKKWVDKSDPLRDAVKAVVFG